VRSVSYGFVLPENRALSQRIIELLIRTISILHW
jgi:hypothetical protein